MRRAATVTVAGIGSNALPSLVANSAVLVSTAVELLPHVQNSGAVARLETEVESATVSKRRRPNIGWEMIVDGLSTDTGTGHWLPFVCMLYEREAAEITQRYVELVERQVGLLTKAQDGAGSEWAMFSLARLAAWFIGAKTGDSSDIVHHCPIEVVKQVTPTWERLWQTMLHRLDVLSARTMDSGLLLLAGLLEARWVVNVVDVAQLCSHSIWQVPCFSEPSRLTDAALLFALEVLRLPSLSATRDKVVQKWHMALLRLVTASICSRHQITVATSAARQPKTGALDSQLLVSVLLKLHGIHSEMQLASVCGNAFAQWMAHRVMTAGSGGEESFLLIESQLAKIKMAGGLDGAQSSPKYEVTAVKVFSNHAAPSKEHVSQLFSELSRMADLLIGQCSDRDLATESSMLLGFMGMLLHITPVVDKPYHIGSMQSRCMQLLIKTGQVSLRQMRKLVSSMAESLASLDAVLLLLDALADLLNTCVEISKVVPKLLGAAEIGATFNAIGELVIEIWLCSAPVRLQPSKGRMASQPALLMDDEFFGASLRSTSTIKALDDDVDDRDLEMMVDLKPTAFGSKSSQESPDANRRSCRAAAISVVVLLHKLGMMEDKEVLTAINRGWDQLSADPKSRVQALAAITTMIKTATAAAVLCEKIEGMCAVMKDSSPALGLALLDIVSKVVGDAADGSDEQQSGLLGNTVLTMINTIAKTKRIFNRDVKRRLVELIPLLLQYNEEMFESWAEWALNRLADDDYAVRKATIGTIRYLFRIYTDHDSLIKDVLGIQKQKQDNLAIEISNVLTLGAIIAESSSQEPRLLFRLCQSAEDSKLRRHIRSALEYAANALEYESVTTLLEYHLGYILRMWLRSKRLSILNFPIKLLDESLELHSFVRRYASFVVPVAVLESDDDTFKVACRAMRMTKPELIKSQHVKTFATVYPMLFSDAADQRHEGHRLFMTHLAIPSPANDELAGLTKICYHSI